MKNNKTIWKFLIFVVMILSVIVFFNHKESLRKNESNENFKKEVFPSKTEINNSVVNNVPRSENSITIKQNQITESEFAELTNKAMSELPLTTNAQIVLKKVHNEADKESHHHSIEYKKMNIAAGEILGNIKQALSDNPNLKPIAINFYQECTLKKEFFPQVRGLCLYNLRLLVSKEKSDLINVEYAIKAIADKLE